MAVLTPHVISLPGPMMHTQLLLPRLQPQTIAVFSSSPPGQLTMLLHASAALMQLVPFPIPVPVQSNWPTGQTASLNVVIAQNTAEIAIMINADMAQVLFFPLENKS